MANLLFDADVILAAFSPKESNEEKHLLDAVEQLCLDEAGFHDPEESDEWMNWQKCDAKFLEWMNTPPSPPSESGLTDSTSSRPNSRTNSTSSSSSNSSISTNTSIQTRGPETPQVSVAPEHTADARDCPSDTQTAEETGSSKGRQSKLPDRKFPVAQNGRCNHNESWERLRGRKGHSYFFCGKCGVCSPVSRASSLLS